MRILFVSDNFPPEVNAPASRTYEHCREWVKLGHSVTVITCFPNFPHGKIYSGFANKMASHEQVDGIDIIRVWSYISANAGFIKRIIDYLSFMLSSILVSFKLGQYDMVIGTSPQFFTVVSAHLIGKIKNIPFVFELRDIWPESIRAVGAMQDSIIIDTFEWLELFLYRKASRIISVTNAFKSNLIARGITEGKISVVRNGVDLTRFIPQRKNLRILEKLHLNQTFNIGYIGTHGLAHALETVVDAAEIISQLPHQKYHNIRFILMGSGANKNSLIKYAEVKKLKNILFLESVPKDEVVAYWSILDLAIVHLKNTPLFRSVIPSKIFECMGMGIPLLHGVYGESAEIVQTENIGVVFEPENPKALVDSICLLYDEADTRSAFRLNCLAAVQKYDRTNLAKKMLSFLIIS